jgi:hypothetical protein
MLVFGQKIPDLRHHYEQNRKMEGKGKNKRTKVTLVLYLISWIISSNVHIFQADSANAPPTENSSKQEQGEYFSQLKDKKISRKWEELGLARPLLKVGLN